jgi:hypothetical protein
VNNIRTTLRTAAAGLALIGLAATFAGCSAMHTAIDKRNLDVQTRMSDSIFLEPVSPDKKIIYVSVRNTSDKDFDIKGGILERLTASGFRITSDPEQANFMLQANVLQVGRADIRNVNNAVEAGFGGATIGAGAAVAGGADSGRGVAMGGLVGAALGVVGDALVDDVLYSAITDVQIRERPRGGEQVVQRQSTTASQGSATTLNQQVTGGQVNWKTYRTRIASTANQVNLEFPEAKPELEKGLVRVISGLFAE